MAVYSRLPPGEEGPPRSSSQSLIPPRPDDGINLKFHRYPIMMT